MRVVTHIHNIYIGTLHNKSMGETISKSAGKVYAGDRVDYFSTIDSARVAEVLKVLDQDHPGLSLLCEDTKEVKRSTFPSRKKSQWFGVWVSLLDLEYFTRPLQLDFGGRGGTRSEAR